MGLNILVVFCYRYSQMSEEEVKLDRYAKFRALGQFEEFLVPGGQWRETRASRAKVRLDILLLLIGSYFTCCVTSDHSFTVM